ncbi:hypothetical protein [Streptomyces sp. NPDC001530]|uniref:hypothetical protein n=1 Tax=Streptomyces sp. NPDC001530 TaxID=3364582 RepID=UPI00369403A9
MTDVGVANQALVAAPTQPFRRELTAATTCSKPAEPVATRLADAAGRQCVEATPSVAVTPALLRQDGGAHDVGVSPGGSGRRARRAKGKDG